MASYSYRGGRLAGRIRLASLAPILALVLGGCQAIQRLAPEEIEPAYKGLAGQNCAVMVWADPGTLVENPTLPIDMAQRLQKNLMDAESANVVELKDSKWVPPSAITRYQDDHPEIAGDAMVDVIGKFPQKVTRLIYLEVTKLNLHPAASPEMYRGEIEGTLRVIELKEGKNKLAYEETRVICIFPRHVTDEGLPAEGGLNDNVMYQGTVAELADELALRFVPHEQE